MATASATNSAEIDLTWSGSTDNVAVQGYLVYRDGTLVTSVPVTTTAYADIGLNAGSTHTYTVAAVDEAANVSARSAASNGATTLSGVKTTSYTYDLADRLLTIGEADNTSLGFTYDALGRHGTRYSGATTLDAYSYAGGTDSVVADVPNAGSTVTSAIDAAGNRLASSAAGSVGWLLADLHGDLAGQTGSSGVLIDAFRYDAYGRLEGTLLTGSAVPTPWRYQGKLLESTSGNPDLYDFAARTYAPDLGTFLSLDSMAGSLTDPVSLNRYLYAEANPETLTDPDGHCTRNNPDCRRTRTEVRQDNARHQSQYLAEERAKQRAIGTRDQSWVTATPAEMAFSAAIVAQMESEKAAKETRAESAAIRSSHVQSVNHQSAIARSTCSGGQYLGCTSGASGGGGFDLTRAAHFALGAIGAVPIIGIGANLADAGLYLGQGDLLGAGLSIASAVPLAGDFADAAREGRLALSAGEEGLTAVREATAVGEAAAPEATGAVRAFAGGSPTNIVRGGTLDNILKQPVDENGLLTELSVNSGEGLSVAELASYPPVSRYGKVSVTTVEKLFGGGGTITPDPVEGNPFHSLVSGITPQDLVDIMEEMANPSRLP